MRLVVADTSPINYLLPIGHIEILPALFGKVIPPEMVWNELKHPKAPPVVQNWAAATPPWVDVRSTGSLQDPSLESLDAGEKAAIILAVQLDADLLLMDDEEGVIARGRRALRLPERWAF